MSTETEEHLDRLREAREHVQNSGGRRAVRYLLGRRHDDEMEYGELSIDEPTVYNEFTEILSQNITSLINSVTEDGKRVVEFDIRHTNRNRTPIQYLSLDKLPEFARLSEVCSDEIDLEVTSYKEDEEDLEIEIIQSKSPENDSVLGIQEYSSEYMLGSTMWTRLVKSPGEKHYNKFEQQVVGIPADVRAIVYDGYLYSESPKALERIFEFEKEYQTEVDEVITGLSEKNIELDVSSNLQDTLRSDIRHLRKFHEMKELGVHEEIEIEDIERVIDDRDLPIEAEKRNGDLRLSIDSGHDRWELLDLLADDHVVSEMTDNPYNADGKELVDD